MQAVSNITAVILAGGKGTRISHLAKDLPKYLMPINDYECFADIHLKWAKQNGFKMTSHILNIYGICKECLETEEK